MAGSNTQEATDRLVVLKDEIARLDAYEKTIEQHKNWVQQSIKNITEDISNQHLSYVTHEDACKCFEGETLLSIQAPNKTTLDMQPVMENGKKKFQIHLKSSDGQIYVLLVNKETKDCNPVAVQVPPPKEVADAMRETEEEEEQNVRRSGRGKTKASTPADAPSKRRKLEKQSSTEGVQAAAEDDQSDEVSRILGSSELVSGIPGLEELVSVENPRKSNAHSSRCINLKHFICFFSLWSIDATKPASFRKGLLLQPRRQRRCVRPLRRALIVLDNQRPSLLDCDWPMQSQSLSRVQTVNPSL